MTDVHTYICTYVRSQCIPAASHCGWLAGLYALKQCDMAGNSGSFVSDEEQPKGAGSCVASKVIGEEYLRICGNDAMLGLVAGRLKRSSC